MSAGWAQALPEFMARHREIAAHTAMDKKGETAPSGAVRGNSSSGAGQEPRPDGFAARQLRASDAVEHTYARGLTEAEQRVVAGQDAGCRSAPPSTSACCRKRAVYVAPLIYPSVRPDGRQNAVGRAVQIDVSPVDVDPDATITKMEVVKAAALVPAERSAADCRVAAFADALRAKQVAGLAAQRMQAVDLRA